jgi:hypothetical protein
VEVKKNIPTTPKFNSYLGIYESMETLTFALLLKLRHEKESGPIACLKT